MSKLSIKNIKALNWAALMVVSLTSFFLGILFAQIFGIANLDAEISGLLGGALGAGITVAGAVWLAQYQHSKQVYSFNKLIGDSVTAIRNEAYILVALSEVEIDTNYKIIGEECREQISRIKEAFNLFESNMATGSIANYETRLWVYRLEKTIQNNLRIFDKEDAWLNGKITKAVVGNAQGDLITPAQEIFEACVTAAKELNHNAPLPSNEELQQRNIP